VVKVCIWGIELLGVGESLEDHSLYFLTFGFGGGKESFSLEVVMVVSCYVSHLR
jgi:hypothetical protein